MNIQPSSGSPPNKISDTVSTVNSNAMIDQIDLQILDLINQRRAAVQHLCGDGGSRLVGRIAEAAARIDGVLNAITRAEDPAADHSITNASKAALLRHVSSICLQSIHQLQAIYLGPQHSYSHLAAIKYFGDATTLTPVASIPAVFDAVAREDALCGIVPIENSTDGRVVDTLGMFVRADMQICGEVMLPIHHNLLATTATRSNHRSA